MGRRLPCRFPGSEGAVLETWWLTSDVRAGFVQVLLENIIPDLCHCWLGNQWVSYELRRLSCNTETSNDGQQRHRLPSRPAAVLRSGRRPRVWATSQALREGGIRL